MAYIFIVSPAILSQAGIAPSAALFATAVAGCISTLAMGLWANLPFAVAPGLTMSGYFVYVVHGQLQMTWQQGLAAVFCSGLVCVALTTFKARQHIIDSIPMGLKRAIASTVGVFVAVIGLYLGKFVTFTSAGFIDGASITSSIFMSDHAMVFYLGLGTSMVLGLRRLHIPAGMLVAIIASAGLYHVLGVTDKGVGGNLYGDPFSSMNQMDFSVFGTPRFWLPVLIFFVLDFFEGIGEFIGMTANTTIQTRDGTVANLKQGLYVDGFGTIGGAFLGTSSLIIFVESAVGIRAGGRTGLTAVTCGLLMAINVIISYFFAPALTWIPAEAASGVLAYVGYLLLSNSIPASRTEVTTHMFDGLVALVMGVITLCTFSLDKSLALGSWAYFVYGQRQGDARKRSLWLGGVALALTAAIVWQHLGD